MTADDFREVALSMPGAVEGAHMNHPDFRVGGRIFATLHADGERGTVKLAPAEQAAILRMHPEVFAPASGAWGRQGWTQVQLNAADRTTARAAILLAWQVVATRSSTRTGDRRTSRGAQEPGTPAQRRRATRRRRSRR